MSTKSALYVLPLRPAITYDLQDLERYIAPLDISDTQPWLLQLFLQGPEYASYSIVDGSNVVAHSDNVAELSCLNYAHVGNPEVGAAAEHCIMLQRYCGSQKYRMTCQRLLWLWLCMLTWDPQKLIISFAECADPEVGAEVLHGAPHVRPDMLRLHARRSRQRALLHRV